MKLKRKINRCVGEENLTFSSITRLIRSTKKDDFVNHYLINSLYSQKIVRDIIAFLQYAYSCLLFISIMGGEYHQQTKKKENS